jgi:hypothetical protein
MLQESRAKRVRLALDGQAQDLAGALKLFRRGRGVGYETNGVRLDRHGPIIDPVVNAETC